MGLEARCTMRWQGRTAEGKLHLDSKELTFRGDARLVIPRAGITQVRATDGTVEVRFAGDAASFALGVAAEKWVRALATVKTRLEKLGVTPGLVVSVIGVDDAGFRDELVTSVGAFANGDPVAGGDLLFFGVRTRADLARIAALASTLQPSGALWTLREKGQADVTEARVRAAGLAAGLVDVKVASFSPTHTAEKFVLPLASRGAPAKPKKAAPAKPKKAAPAKPKKAAPAKPKKAAPAKPKKAAPAKPKKAAPAKPKKAAPAKPKKAAAKAKR